MRAERTFAADEGRSRRTTFRDENRRRVNALLDEIVQPIADGHGASLAQVAIAWCTGQPGVTAALVGARRPEQVRENAGAGALRLTGEELETIGAAFARLEILPPPDQRSLRARAGRLLRRLGLRS